MKKNVFKLLWGIWFLLLMVAAVAIPDRPGPARLGPQLIGVAWIACTLAIVVATGGYFWLAFRRIPQMEHPVVYTIWISTELLFCLGLLALFLMAFTG